MRKSTLLVLSAAPLSVLAAAAWAQQVIYPQKPSPAVPYGQQGQPEQAMTYEQALAQQQSWNNRQAGNGQASNSPADPQMSVAGQAANQGDAAPVAVDPDGNPIFGAVGGDTQPSSEMSSQPGSQPTAGNAARNEAQLEADRLRQDPQAAAQSQQETVQAPQSDSGGYENQQPYLQQGQRQYAAPQPQQAYAQPTYPQSSYPQQPSYPQQSYPQQSYAQPGYSQPSYPQQRVYTQPQPSYAAPGPEYSYAQPAPRPVAPPVVVAPYRAYPPPPPVVAYGYPYAYPYGYGVHGFYRGYRRGYPVVRGYVGGPRGGVYFQAGR